MSAAKAFWPPAVRCSATIGSWFVGSTSARAPWMSALVSAGAPPSANQPSGSVLRARTACPSAARAARASATDFVVAALPPASGAPVTSASPGAGVPRGPSTLRSQS